MVDINWVTLYQYEDSLNASFILEAYPSLGESNADFFRKVNVEGGILKVCLRCEKYYNEVRVFLANLWEKERIDPKEKEKGPKDYLTNRNGLIIGRI